MVKLLVTQKRRQIVQVILDLMVIFCGFQLVYLLAQSSINPWRADLIEFDRYLRLSLIGTVLMLSVFIWQGVYRYTYNYLQIEDSRRFFRAIITGDAAILLPIFYMQQEYRSILLVSLAVVVIPILLSIEKSLLSAILGILNRKAPAGRKLVIMGNGVPYDYLLRRALKHLNPTYKPVGLLTKDPARLGEQMHSGSREVDGVISVIGMYQDLPGIIRKGMVEEVWFNDPDLTDDELEEFFLVCKEHTIEFSIIPTFGGMPLTMVEMVKMEGIPIIRQRKIHPRPVYDFTKRVTDIVGSLFILTVFSPIMFLISAWIKLDSRGPILFKHDRIGHRGKPFNMLKFRTLHKHTEPYAVSPQDHSDERITRAGRFIRRSSFDELPQLINVLRGEMSLVGPRPEMPFIVEKYNDFQQLRLAVKPGVTGPWQISADRSVPIHQNMDYDLYYIENRSAILDLIILWRTLWTALKGI